MKNEILADLPSGSKPSSDNVCIDCLHAHWHIGGGGAVCKCRLISAVVWNARRGEHGITACTGSETLKMKPSNSPCVSCQYAVWYKDSGELHGYCRDIYRKIYGKDFNGNTISTIKKCNSYEKMEVL